VQVRRALFLALAVAVADAGKITPDKQKTSLLFVIPSLKKRGEFLCFFHASGFTTQKAFSLKGVSLYLRN
jgi:hypothetical protein